MEQNKTEEFKIDGRKHECNDPNCQIGWCDGGLEFPKRCKCGGLIHAEFGDENSDGDYWVYRKCDNCGDDFEEVR
jgi:hypothetical protein